jgi:hypothetical protein
MPGGDRQINAIAAANALRAQVTGNCIHLRVVTHYGTCAADKMVQMAIVKDLTDTDAIGFRPVAAVYG